MLVGSLTAACYSDDDPSREETPAGVTPTAQSEPSVEHPTPLDPTIPPLEGLPNRFIGFQGVFHVPLWDDRNLSDEEKAKDPWFNPSWAPFSECLAGRGLEVRADPSQQFAQADLDRLLARLNSEYPDTDANKAIPYDAKGKVEGDAGVFLDCAEAWLTKTPQEIYELTGVPNEWWPPKALATATPAA
jgi:hypothetical protein